MFYALAQHCGVLYQSKQIAVHFFNAILLVFVVNITRDGEKSIFTHMASIYKKLLSVQKKRLPKKRVHLRQNWFGTWPPFHCFGTQNNMAAVISCENAPYSL